MDISFCLRSAQEKRTFKGKREGKRSAQRNEVIAEAMARSGGQLAATEVHVRCGLVTGRYLVSEGVVIGTSETVSSALILLGVARCGGWVGS